MSKWKEMIKQYPNYKVLPMSDKTCEMLIRLFDKVRVHMNRICTYTMSWQQSCH